MIMVMIMMIIMIIIIMTMTMAMIMTMTLTMIVVPQGFQKGITLGVFATNGSLACWISAEFLKSLLNYSKSWSKHLSIRF
jgi:membrane glycosyltransferase